MSIFHIIMLKLLKGATPTDDPIFEPVSGDSYQTTAIDENSFQTTAIEEDSLQL